MIPYDAADHKAYVYYRSAVVCGAAGMPLEPITKENYALVRDMIMATFTGAQRNALLMEATNALLMDVAHS